MRVPASTITFNMGTVVSPIGLTSGTLSLARNVTIAGPGANLLTVQRTSGTFGVLTIQPGLTVTMSGVTIAGGTATGSPNRGGGIYNNGSNLTLSAVARDRQHGRRSAGRSSTAPRSASASLTIVNSTLSGNSASAGGAIVNQGAGAIALLTIRNTTISGNTRARQRRRDLQRRAGLADHDHATAPSPTTADDSVGTGGGMYLEPGSGAVVLQNTIVAGNVIGLGPATPDDVSGALDGCVRRIRSSARAPA